MRLKLRPRGAALLLSLAGVLAAPPSFAADPAAQPPAPNAPTVQAPTAGSALARDARASRIIGREVLGTGGEKLGRIDDLIVDMDTGRLQYAVLSFGGVAGLGDKLFAYPANAFRTAADSDDLTLNVDKERLRHSPGFDKARWPGLDATAYWRDVDRYHGAATAQGAQHLLRMSKLLDKDVNDRQGKDAGEVEEVVVNMAQQRVHYVVLDFDKQWSPDDKLLALPLSALSLPAGRDKDADLVLNVAREQLDMKRGFDENAWPDVNDPAYRRDVGGWLDHFPPTSRAQAPGR